MTMHLCGACRYVQLPINAVMREAWEEKWQTVELEGVTKQLSFMEAAARLGVGVFASGPLLEGTLLKDATLQVNPLSCHSSSCLSPKAAESIIIWYEAWFLS